ncbi:OmpH family outer membrane protein [bacterium]|nr:OmpH family outer membrane protein [bacterium]MBU1982871.1 OmpH family outer membrane protein [bacterium]
MRRFIIGLLAFGVLLGVGTSNAKELRIAYVDSERLLESSEDFRQVRQKLQEEERGYANQASALEEAVRAMAEELRAQSLMLSQEARKEREDRFVEKQRDLDNFRREIWGENGKLFERNMELSKPVLDKINEAIQKVAEEAGYDYVFDAAAASIVYALPEYDITDRVLDELKKE